MSSPINWRLLGITLAVGALLAVWPTWWVAGLVHDRDTAALIKEQEAALSKQETDLTKACAARQQITYGVSNGLQNDYSAIDGILSVSLRDDAGPACIMPISGQAGGRDAASKPAISQPHGVSRRWLLEFAAEADRVAAQLNRCQDFVDQNWGLYGQ